MEKVLVIIPAYNEEGAIENVIKSVRETVAFADILVVNDGSKDNTSSIARENGASVVDLPYNLGIGGAMQTGYLYAYKNNYDVAIQFDGDGQHDENYIDSLVIEIEKGNNFVIGSRFVSELSKFKSTGTRRMGIKILSFLIRLCTGKKIYDPTSGFRVADRKVIKLFAERYPTEYPEPESTVELISKKFKVKEVPVEMHEREFGTSSIKPLKSIYYMFSVSISIIVASISGEMKK